MDIESLANRLLSHEEILVVNRLEHLLMRQQMNEATGLLNQVLPKMWKWIGNTPVTYSPDAVYRNLYYLNDPSDYVGRQRRHLLELMGDHLQKLISLLIGGHDKLPLGPVVMIAKKMNALPIPLASDLSDFNKVAYVRAKHPSSDKHLPSRIDVRTFSTRQTIFFLMITRNLSKKLFTLLRTKGVVLKQGWKNLRPEWFTWNQPGQLMVIYASDYYLTGARTVPRKRR